MRAATEMRLRWDAARGVGFLPLEAAQVYDADYFAKYVGYADTEQGHAITESRFDLVRRHVAGSRLDSIIDIGIGAGQFLEDMLGRATGTVRKYGFDVNPVGVAWLKDRGLYRDPYAEQFDAMTFFDSMEHIAEPAPLLANAREWVFVSIPVVPGEGPPSKDWKHYRPTEHCWYWTKAGFIEWMSGHGFECLEYNERETELGREFIGSFAFHRAQAPFTRS